MPEEIKSMRFVVKQYVPSGDYYETPIYFCEQDPDNDNSTDGYDDWPSFYLCKDDEPNYPKDTPARVMW
jgi:hypothetical protein